MENQNDANILIFLPNINASHIYETELAAFNSTWGLVFGKVLSARYTDSIDVFLHHYRQNEQRLALIVLEARGYNRWKLQLLLEGLRVMQTDRFLVPVLINAYSLGIGSLANFKDAGPYLDEDVYGPFEIVDAWRLPAGFGQALYDMAVRWE